MSEQAFAVTPGWGQFIRRGDVVYVGDKPVRVLQVDGDTLTIRHLRWYERAWLFLTARRKP